MDSFALLASPLMSATMNRPIRFFMTSGNGFETVHGKSKSKKGRLFRSRVAANVSILGRSSRSVSKEQSSLRTSGSSASASTTSAGESSSCQSFEDVKVTTNSLCSSATTRENGSLSRRLMVQMCGDTWKVSPRRGETIASFQFPPHRDEMLLQDRAGRECGVIIPADSSTTRRSHEYTLYSFKPCFENQEPTIKGDAANDIPSFYLSARICARLDLAVGAWKQTSCHSFTCRTQDGRQFTADNILWSSFQSRAFCIKETTVDSRDCSTSSVCNAARVTCLSDTNRELLVYRGLDPILMLAFVAVMEEIVLVTNL